VKRLFFVLVNLFVVVSASQAQPFSFPTANHALYEPGGEERFFVGTTGKSWTTGTFGCVRSDGWKIHEGLDIRCLQRDRHGEPTDPVLATDDGTVAYINSRPALSNYGRYIVLRHVVEGIEIYSLYAHLTEARANLKPGDPVQRGEQIAVMGRSSNTHEPITRERAHVHFELNLFYNDHFEAWFKRRNPTERNDHGVWNGQNLVGIDPRLILLAERDQGPKFSLLQFIQGRTELCRVQVRQADFSWARRYPMLVKHTTNPTAPIAGYDIALDYNGLPFELVPLTAAEMKGPGRYQLLSVNDAEYAKNPARRLVKRRGSGWELAPNGMSLLDLLTD
jgi:murein DD-endopeptidase MepM/ murein hydrolase activator NlpD